MLLFFLFFLNVLETFWLHLFESREDGSGQTLSVDGSPNRSLSATDGTGSLSVNANGRKLSKSGTMTLEREASTLRW